MSWRPGGGSGSFRRHGLIDGSTFLRSGHGRSNGRSSDEEGGAGGGGAKPASSFLRIRPISGSGNGGGAEAGGSSSGTSRNISSLLRSGDSSSSRGATSSSSASASLALPSSSSSSVTAPSSRSSSFRLAGAREGAAASERVERSNSWRRSHFSSPVTSYFSSGHSSSDKTKHQVAVAALNPFLRPVCHLFSYFNFQYLCVTQGGFDGRRQRSCKCNYVDFYKDARPSC